MENKRHFLIRTFKHLNILILFSVFFACNNKDKAKITLTLKDKSSQYAVIEEQRVSERKILDTINFNRNGKLSYSLQISQPTFINIRFENKQKCFLIIEPNQKIDVKGNGSESPKDYEFKNSPESKKLNALYDSLFSTREILKVLETQYTEAISENVKDSISNEYNKIFEVHKRFSTDYVLKNLNSLISLAALYQEIRPNDFVFGSGKDMQFFKLVSDSLTKYYPKHRHVHALKRNFSTMMTHYNVEKLKSAAEIKEGLPEIVLPDLKGDSIKLTGIKNRYVLLNFWHDKEETSLKVLPLIKNCYDNNKSKSFNVYNIYLGKNFENWKNLIRFEELNDIINVSDSTFPYSLACNAYNIKTIPANYLLDLTNKTVLAKDINPNEVKNILNRNK